ncbi:Concanavalin A-like lectin/glucanase, subgroup [Artemisia annua]|uniref:RING-type E3 ubiquitin transferase n=1 Tax=Artemisia annua TaxID=35608 RepID=A0A2U1NRM3_ARTAN|nr:Concanavalin A-like lectin/glucanase, subgroup [Artemisia annua]
MKGWNLVVLKRYSDDEIFKMYERAKREFDHFIPMGTEDLKKQQIVDALFTSDKQYRRYTVDEIEVATKSFSKSKVVGEGAYGTVYKCKLDHTPVAIKVLWSETSEKKRTRTNKGRLVVAAGAFGTEFSAVDFSNV